MARLPRAREGPGLEISLLVGLAGNLQSTEALACLRVWVCVYLSYPRHSQAEALGRKGRCGKGLSEKGISLCL